jgi:hypothetical protein
MKHLKTFESYQDTNESTDLEVWFAQLPLKQQLEITGIKNTGKTEALWHEAESEWYAMPEDKKKEWYDKLN